MLFYFVRLLSRYHVHHNVCRLHIITCKRHCICTNLIYWYSAYIHHTALYVNLVHISPSFTNTYAPPSVTAHLSSNPCTATNVSSPRAKSPLSDIIYSRTRSLISSARDIRLEGVSSNVGTECVGGVVGICSDWVGLCVEEVREREESEVIYLF